MQLFMGIDVSKGYADFIIIDQNKKVVEANFQLDDTYNGHAELYEVVFNLFEKYPSLALSAAVESTGGYENNWLNALSNIQNQFNIKVARLNPLRKFYLKEQSFFGMHPVFKESGDGKSGFRLSKRGRRAPRYILYMVALTAIRCNPLIREIYNRKVDEGMAPMAAIGVCMHKILRIVYGMLKHNRPFDENIDRHNQSRKSKSKIKKFSKRRRYQGFDKKAPISARQTKRRKLEEPLDTKEQAASQNGLAIECGFAAPVPSSLS
jgi:transposase